MHQLCGTGYVQDQKQLESVQRLWTHVSGLEGPESQVYGEHLKTLDLFLVEGCFLTAFLIKRWKVFHGLCPIQASELGFTKFRF